MVTSAPIHYVCTTPTNLLGLRHWIPDLHFLCAADLFDGNLPRVAHPVALEPGDHDSFERMNARILSDPDVRRYIDRSGAGGRVMFLMFDAADEVRARAAGLSLCLPPAALRRGLDDKIATTRIGDDVGVRSVPNVLARVESYAGMRRVAAALGHDLVLQLPFGDSGQTTFFVGDEADYLRHAPEIEAASEVKIMRRIQCRQAAIEACVTRNGIAVGPLATELVGFDELTPYRGGWCGNEIAPGAFSEGALDEAAAMTRRIGERLAAMGYRGVFGLDFLLDEEHGDLFLGEMNPRITGLTPLSTQVARDVGCAPLMLLHILEWLDVPHATDVREASARFRRLDGARAWSQLVVKETRDAAPAIERAPKSGIWAMDDRGVARVSETSFDTADIRGAGQALVVRTVDHGFARPRGTCLARTLAPERAMTDGYDLLPRARAWIASIRGAFDARVTGRESRPSCRARRARGCGSDTSSGLARRNG
jgi:biotin carboxylase